VITDKISSGGAQVRSIADQAYASAIGQETTKYGGKIDAQNTIRKIGNLVKSTERVTGDTGVYGRLRTLMERLKKLQPAAEGFYKKKVPTATQLGRQFKGENLTDIATEARISKKEFSALRDEINSLYRENPADRDIRAVIESLYDDAEKSGLVGMKDAKKLQSEAFDLEDLVSKWSKKKTIDYHKLSRVEKRELDLIKQKTGEDIVSDLKSMSSAKHFKKVSEHINKVNKRIGMGLVGLGTASGVMGGLSTLTNRVKRAVGANQ
jgi:hypothetical protein